MPNVRVLPPEIVSKIAAGEIIERPASVIKELMENSFDAQTRSIEIFLKDAGKTLIHIKDSGSGIEKDDLNNIFFRHATSKIRNLDDLSKISSLGFRGEALYSISAIADVILRSKTAGQDTGWEIHLRGGKKLDLRPVSMPTGTELEIKELFFNTPARKKFLKSDTSEMNQVLNTFIPYTFLYPQCRFRLNHQGKDLIDIHPAEKPTERIAEILNLNSKHMIETKKEFPDKKICVRLILGDINISRSRRDMQFVFVNDRPVQSRSFGFHINQTYRLIFPPEKYPFFAAFINLPADEVDVNVHPAKREVKIRHEQAVISLLRAMCETALLSHGQAKQVTISALEKSNATPASWEEAPARSGEKIFESSGPSDFQKELQRQFSLEDVAHWPASPDGRQAPEIHEDFFAQHDENLQKKLKRSRFIGSFIKKFLLFEVDRMLLVVDQHAAQERITFEKLLQQMESGNMEVQHLLSPILIKLSPQEILSWEEGKERLEEVGLTTTQFDNQTIAVHTHPQLIQEPETAVRAILAGEDVARCDYNTIATWACKASIRAGDSLNRQQAEYQREELLKCKDPFTCPHGRPTVIEVSEKFLDKQFLRT